MAWVKKSVVPSIEKIRRAIGDDDYYEWLHSLMEGVELRQKATEQIRIYHDAHGAPVEEIPYPGKK